MKKVLISLLLAALLLEPFSSLSYAQELSIDEALSPVESEEAPVLIPEEMAVQTVPEEVEAEEVFSAETIPVDTILEEESDRNANESVIVSYAGHVEKKGWTAAKYNGEIMGSVGSGLRLEQYHVTVSALTPYEGGIEYMSHVQSYGWDKTWRRDGEDSGVKGKRVEAIRVRLTGELAEYYDVYYRVHTETFGWLDWACNGDEAGTTGYAKRIEAMQIVLVDKDAEAPGNTGYALMNAQTGIAYATHVQTYGWQGERSNGGMSGTSGKSKRLEGIRIRLQNCPYEGTVEYQTHVQTYGWETQWKTDNEVSGTVGQAKRLEAIRIRLTGEVEEKCDVWYRVHSQKFGWLGWAKNGEEAGTSGYGYRLEAIQIMLLPKDARAFDTTSPYRTRNAAAKGWSIRSFSTDADKGLISWGNTVCLKAEFSGEYESQQVICDYTWANALTGEEGIIGSGEAGALYAWTPEFSGDYTITMHARDAKGSSETKSVALTVIHDTFSKEDCVFTAHKGYSSLAPGNTIPAFILAGQAGFDSIETDVSQTVDGVFVISHDDNIKSTTGVDVRISSLQYSELTNYSKYHVRKGENVHLYSDEELRIPTLKEYLDICIEYGCVPQIDTKNLNTYDSIKDLYEILVEYGMEDDVILTSFNNLYLQYMRNLNDKVVLTYGVDNTNYVDLEWLKNSRVGISANYNLILSHDILDRQSEGIAVNAYTVNERKMAAVLIEKGVTAITTETVLWD